ncbi:hypothetical protein BX661DRAFT_186640 [Kickxella alabastrina]|uniref:uncharacterized protein n=1 Tax=Kickxella alabastrina TaxID=61397 RepID=UPI0022210C1F|nr:uncharacterized protein BX661DRAFT_186640 [Kickxella alabastrina]KAI7823451.1 hypothetical protein BX661DRAFT_186640 [Kickxella alabastrina]KAJ1945073.1 hypothetical protein GGF37_001884 [Kickxella alabastrina]
MKFISPFLLLLATVFATLVMGLLEAEKYGLKRFTARYNASNKSYKEVHPILLQLCGDLRSSGPCADNDDAIFGLMGYLELFNRDWEVPRYADYTQMVNEFNSALAASEYDKIREDYEKSKADNPFN